MWIIGFGIAAILWGGVTIIGGADSAAFPWLLIFVGIIALTVSGLWYGPHRHPGGSGTVLEERHYYGDPPTHHRR
ncbi:hypothetical protein ADK86_27690 [Streptomyces sp. NRRL F-5755]|uniref:hypothetical protein n=1 Tax=Streptomyces sp. NRRL F-5755 TaxID=1519475 RepID=UPI0006AE6D28|nr:hypothetical protein [Streptomyces sp. NRRL F-5755]KOT89931.1 hypothetical protein ADK86_27690 [Streptomyces sp. NRRL F-5755]